MCTLSWLPDGTGYLLLFNRDERRSRGPALPPARQLIGGTAVLAPRDSDFGGTWIGVNEHGVAAALLNRYDDTPADPGAPRVSRGLLLASLLAAPTAEALMQDLGAGGLGHYLPFTVGATGPGSALYLADWTGRTLERSVTRHPGLVRTSSGRDQREAELVRGRVWHELAADAGGVSAEALEHLHRSHRPERGAFSVCMHREEAETQSLTTIRVDASGVSLRYVPGPPCLAATPVLARLSLEAPRR